MEEIMHIGDILEDEAVGNVYRHGDSWIVELHSESSDDMELTVALTELEDLSAPEEVWSTTLSVGPMDAYNKQVDEVSFKELRDELSDIPTAELKEMDFNFGIQLDNTSTSDTLGAGVRLFRFPVEFGISKNTEGRSARGHEASNTLLNRIEGARKSEAGIEVYQKMIEYLVKHKNYESYDQLVYDVRNEGPTPVGEDGTPAVSSEIESTAREITTTDSDGYLVIQ